MKKPMDNKGLTLIEIIVTLALLGIVISPIMGFFITSQKINNESEREFKSIQLAQKYMEEIKSMDKIDVNKYDYDNFTGTYERTETEDGYAVNIEIKPASENENQDETVIYDAELTIGAIDNSNTVYWNEIPYPGMIINDNVNLAIEDAKIILGENELSTTAIKIKVVFNTSVALNIIKSSRYLELYIENNSVADGWEINVLEGTIPKIFGLNEEAANNILYDITVNVTKDEYSTIVEGTKIFK